LDTNGDIRLVRMNADHLASTFQWLVSSPKLREQVDCLKPPTAEENEKYWRSLWDDPTREDYAIIQGNALHVGNCGLKDIDRKRKKVQLWIYLGGSYRCGIGNTALRQLMKRAFEELQMNRLYLRVLANNRAALKFYLSLGFAQEGIWREDTIRDTKFVDSVWFSMLEREYFKQKTC